MFSAFATPCAFRGTVFSRLLICPSKRQTVLFFRAHRYSSQTPSMAARTVQEVVVAREQSEGDGARVRRSIGNGVSVDPFLMLDEFRVSRPAGFPSHPHRGMMTVTYMLEGTFEHKGAFDWLFILRWTAPLFTVTTLDMR